MNDFGYGMYCFPILLHESVRRHPGRYKVEQAIRPLDLSKENIRPWSKVCWSGVEDGFWESL